MEIYSERVQRAREHLKTVDYLEHHIVMTKRQIDFNSIDMEWYTDGGRLALLTKLKNDLLTLRAELLIAKNDGANI